jgi:hypothetical protein
MKAGWFTKTEAQDEVKNRLNGQTDMEALKKGVSFSVDCKR